MGLEISKEKYRALTHEASRIISEVAGIGKIGAEEITDLFEDFTNLLNTLIEPPETESLDNASTPENHIGGWVMCAPAYDLGVLVQVQDGVASAFVPENCQMVTGGLGGFYLTEGLQECWAPNLKPFLKEPTPEPQPTVFEEVAEPSTQDEAHPHEGEEESVPTFFPVGHVFESREELLAVAMPGCVVMDDNGDPVTLVPVNGMPDKWVGKGISPLRKGSDTYVVQYWPEP